MKKFIFITILLLGIGYVAEAQSLNGLLRKAQKGVSKAAEDKVEEEAEKEASKFLDNLFKEDTTQTVEDQQETTNSDDSESNYSRFMKSMGVSSSVEKKDVYLFNSQTKMIVEGSDEEGNKQDPVNFLIQSNENNGDMLFSFIDEEGESATFISDKDNNVTLMLTEEDGEKRGFAASIDVDEDDSDYEGTSDENVDECFAKTGKSRKISGYSCNEYRCENDNEIVTAWLTTDIKMKNNQMFGSNPFGTNFKQGKMKGMIIEYDYTSKTDKSTSKMLITSIDEKKSSSFSTEGYQIIGFSNSPQ